MLDLALLVALEEERKRKAQVKLLEQLQLPLENEDHGKPKDP